MLCQGREIHMQGGSPNGIQAKPDELCSIPLGARLAEPDLTDVELCTYLCIRTVC